MPKTTASELANIIQEQLIDPIIAASYLALQVEKEGSHCTLTPAEHANLLRSAQALVDIFAGLTPHMDEEGAGIAQMEMLLDEDERI